MAALANAAEVMEAVRTVRQARLYRPDPVPEEVVEQLLELARWTGSARNTQPWRFVVITDREQLRKISQLRPPINWVADVPLAIGIVLTGANVETEAYDEGRLTERILIGAKVLGLGGGIAWFGDEAQQAEGERILGVPEGMTSRGVVAIGSPTTTKDHRPNANVPGRTPLSEIVSYDRYGQTSR